MLSVSTSQIERLSTSSEVRFRAELVAHVRAIGPAYTRVTDAVLLPWLDVALQRASGYGFTEQASIAQFASLMAAVAPNFDLHPQFHAALIHPGIPANQRLDALSSSVPEIAWDQAQANSSSIGWHLPVDTFHLSVGSRRTQALAQALPDHIGSAEGLNLQAGAAAEALQRRGWHDEDASFAFTAAWLVYGPDLDDPRKSPPWAPAVLDSASALKTRATLLRMRIALDIHVWI